MKQFALILVAVLVFTAGTAAQTPQTGVVYDQLSGKNGDSLVVAGKTYGPYSEVEEVVLSASRTAAVFVVTTKKDQTVIVAQGRENAPLPSGYESDDVNVSDDGKFWSMTASNDDDQTLLVVNGKSYGPFVSVDELEFAETGGGWIASVETGEDEYSILLNGQPVGQFTYVNHLWMFPDGKAWGYCADNDDDTLVVTSEQTFEEVSSAWFSSMNPREAHWGYSFEADEEVTIVVDGKSYDNYTSFGGMTLSNSGRHWAFEAERQANGAEVVVIDGKDYPGSHVEAIQLGGKEGFSWEVTEGSKVTLKTLMLP